MRTIHWQRQPLRSLLFAPGNHARRIERVGEFGSDAIVLDLEDAVADGEKDSARAMVREALPTYDDSTVVVVRANSEDSSRLEADIQAVAHPGLDAVMVPKIERPETLQRVDAIITALERERGLEVGRIRVLGIVETARGLVRCEEIALSAPERLVTIVFGLGDYTVDVGVDITAEGAELLYARSRIVVAARAAGLRPPLDGPYLDLHDLPGLVADCERSRSLGFQGRVIVYPGQVAPAQEMYSSLSADEAESCRRIVTAFESAEADGVASIQVDGRFIDYPIYHRARHKLSLYEAATGTASRA